MGTKVEANRGGQGRLVVQVWQDRQPLVKAASRWGQRILLALATQMNLELISADVSEAFRRGVAFEEL